MAEAVNARSDPKRVRKRALPWKERIMPEAVNARSGQCPKRSMPEAVPSVRGKRALPGKERIMSEAVINSSMYMTMAIVVVKIPC